MEHTFKKMARVVRDMAGNMELTTCYGQPRLKIFVKLTFDLLEERRYMVVVEWKFAAEQDVHDHSSTPNVDLRPGIQSENDLVSLGSVKRNNLLSRYYFRSSVIRTPA